MLDKETIERIQEFLATELLDALQAMRDKSRRTKAPIKGSHGMEMAINQITGYGDEMRWDLEFIDRTGKQPKACFTFSVELHSENGDED